MKSQIFVLSIFLAAATARLFSASKTQDYVVMKLEVDENNELQSESKYPALIWQMT